MKRIYKIFVLIFVVIVFSTVFCYASEVAEGDIGETVSVETIESEDTAPSEPSVIDKLLGILGSEKMTEMVSIIGALAMLAVGFFLKKMMSGIGDKITSELKVSKSYKEAAEQAISGFENKLDERLKEVEERLLLNGVTPEQIERVCEAVKTLGDMFNTVYQGSSTIPAAIKEQEARKFNHIIDVLEEPSGDGK